MRGRRKSRAKTAMTVHAAKVPYPTSPVMEMALNSAIRRSKDEDEPENQPCNFYARTKQAENHDEADRADHLIQNWIVSHCQQDKARLKELLDSGRSITEFEEENERYSLFIAALRMQGAGPHAREAKPYVSGHSLYYISARDERGGDDVNQEVFNQEAVNDYQVIIQVRKLNHAGSESEIKTAEIGIHTYTAQEIDPEIFTFNPEQKLKELHQIMPRIRQIYPDGGPQHDIFNMPKLFINPITGPQESESELQQQFPEVDVYVLDNTTMIQMAQRIPDHEVKKWLTAPATLKFRSDYGMSDQFTFLEKLEDIESALSKKQEYIHYTRIARLTDNLAGQITDQVRSEQVMTARIEELQQQNATQEENLKKSKQSASRAATARNEDAERRQAEEAAREVQQVEERNKVLQERNQVLQERIEVKDQSIAKLNEENNDLKRSLGMTPEGWMPDDAGEEDDETPQSGREAAVLEAITKPERFPNLRFLESAMDNLSRYGKPRPTGEEIITALDAINNLSQLYYEQDSKTGNWVEHFHLPGWTYSPKDSRTTMGKHGDERVFTDHDTQKRVVIDRHLTYPTGNYGGLQMYFDKDDSTQKFIVAYIGTHKDVAYQRS